MRNLDPSQYNRTRFEYHAEHIAAAINGLAEYGPLENSWADLAPHTERARTEQDFKGAQSDNPYNALSMSSEQQIRSDLWSYST